MIREIKFEFGFINHAPNVITLDEVIAGNLNNIIIQGEGQGIKYKRQFTNKTDKNKEELFEGDIVRVKGTKRVGEYITTIIYYNQGFTLKINNTYLNNDSCLTGVEKIGDIHNNPELIK